MDKQQRAALELYRREPTDWRDSLLVDVGQGVPWHSVMAEFQRKDFEALDKALKYVAGASDQMPIHKFFLQRGRGSSKTTDIASCVLWLMAFCRRKLVGYIAAEDKEQAQLMREQMEKLLGLNPWMAQLVEVQRNCVRNKLNDASVRFLSRDTASSFGLTPDIAILDEFTHLQQESFFSSFVSSHAKRDKHGAILIICGNAGFGMDWKWQIREVARTSKDWYFSAPLGHAPWYNPETIAEQRRLLSETEFRRLWLNEWQSRGGEYISLEEADACVNTALSIRDVSEADGHAYIASLDYAEKHDRTVGTVAHQWGNKIIVDRMDVIDPSLCEGGICRVEWCEQWIHNIAARFGGRNGRIFFIVDPWQLKSVIQRLQDQYYIEEFEFKSGTGNWQLSRLLRQLVLNKRIEWYSGCGQILDQHGNPWLPRGLRDDLSTELAALHVKQLQGERWRLEHAPGSHDDRAFALGAAAHFIIQNGTDWEGFVS